MPIKFQVKPLEGYFISKWFGTILNNEILSSYEKFFENDEWIPELNELADFSQVDMSKIHNFVLMNLSKYAEDIYNKKGTKEVKVAVYAPKDFPQSITELYRALA